MESLFAAPGDRSILASHTARRMHCHRLRHGSLLWSSTSSGSDTPNAIGNCRKKARPAHRLAAKHVQAEGAYKARQPVSETKQPCAIKEVRHDL
jgi:hypothetical protein